ncbi:MAG TPA: DUF4268 domain-containing protein [Candidatus Sulfotelmatobacter sp.]|nr:DUF4268 domain-containing protein [Candidatus Sulfotelmatobacter sp.]
MAGVRASQLRREFWQAFKLYMSNTSTIGCSRASCDGWMWHSADLSAGYLASLVNARRGDIGVRFRLNEVNADTVYSFLLSRRPKMNDALGLEPTWRQGDRGSHVIEVMRAADIRERAAWPEHMAWLKDRLEGFRVALWPLVGRVPPPRRRRLWNEELFFRELSEWNLAGLIPATQILRDARRRGESIQWGRGGQSGSSTPTIRRRGVAYQLVSARTDGTLQLLFARLRELPLFEDRARRLELLEQVNQVEHVHLPDQSIDQRPAIPLALLSDPGAGTGFVSLMDWFHDAVKDP